MSVVLSASISHENEAELREIKPYILKDGKYPILYFLHYYSKVLFTMSVPLLGTIFFGEKVEERRGNFKYLKLN